ncbi:hypothetical protein AJ80_05557 [Polytolypa hystricis UAMH7299]|uniref:Uncharacterized protein n=1 Tax=Polytolypa hystricis (strain UAMH7299) TaxID=1447883 RepID=A0A2B7Y2W5_POLH7|nr:hypothetical protein AJ80_05557 [Polytolypa hystricis UAMH7299]
MATTQHDDIVKLIDQIYAAKSQLVSSKGDSNGLGFSDEVQKHHLAKLATDARKLALALQEPNAAFWDLVRRVWCQLRERSTSTQSPSTDRPADESAFTPQCSLLAPIKVSQDMGVFRWLQNHPKATATELATASGGDESLIVRMLRPLVAEGLLAEAGEECYSLTDRGTAFSNPAYEESISFAIDFMPIVLSNPTFFRENGYREPRSHEGLETPLGAYFQKPGYGFFDYLQDHPSVQKTFASAMKAQLKPTYLASTAYPYGEKLASRSTQGDEAVALVDVGGSRGETLLEIKNRYPEIKGRLVTQDRQATFDSITSKPQAIELMVHDIFAEQPIKGATAYHLKRVLHDWSDEECRTILKHVMAAMEKGHSKLLIMDVVLPMTSASFSQAMSDHSMLTFGGKERSEKQWYELLSSVGLKIVKIYQGAEPEALIECEKD